MFGIRTALTLLLLWECSASIATQASSCKDSADICFVVDVSGSIEGDGQNPGYFDKHVRTFLKHFAQKLREMIPGEIQFGVTTFGNEGKLEFPLKSESKEVMEGIDNIYYNTFGENTNTSAGIKIMSTNVLGRNSPNYREDAAHIAIVFTDGNSSRDHEKTIPYANEAKNQGITMISVGFTKKIDVQEIISMASDGPNRPTDYTGVKDAIAKDVFGTCGFVCYVPKIEDLDSTVSQLTSVVRKAICP